MDILPLYGALSPDDQDRVFARSSRRKIIVATNIAETSVTIDGVVFVIDSGLVRQKEYDSNSGIESLVVRKNSQASCAQRRGRAGRTAPGKYFLLDSENGLSTREQFSKPEIQRSNLDNVILSMRIMGIEDIENFDFIDSPGAEAIQSAIAKLQVLGALDEDRNVTEIGRIMAELPLSPEIARMVIEAEKFDCVEKVCTIAAMMSVRQVFNRPRDKEYEADRAKARFSQDGSDFLTLLKVWQEWSATAPRDRERWARENFLNYRGLYEADQIRSQLFVALRRQHIPTVDRNGHDPVAIQKSVASGQIHNLMIKGGRYSYSFVTRRNGGSDIRIHPSSVVFNSAPETMVVSDIVTTSHTYARLCQEVAPEWILELAPQLLSETGRTPAYNSATDIVVEQISFSLKGQYGTFVRKDEPITDRERAGAIFAAAVTSGYVDLPCIRHNRDVAAELTKLATRSGGAVQAPDLAAWYAGKASRFVSREEAAQEDETLRLNTDLLCSAEQRAEIDHDYPESFEVRGSQISVVYSYRAANPSSYYESEREERYEATLKIPETILLSVDASEIAPIGHDGRPKLIFTTTVYSAPTAETLADLKEKYELWRVRNAWQEFGYTHPKREISLREDIDLTPDAYGFQPLAYAQNSQGAEIVAHPGIVAYARRDWNNQISEIRYYVEYFQNESDATAATVKSQTEKAEIEVVERATQERTAAVDLLKTRLTGLREEIEQAAELIGRVQRSTLISRCENIDYELSQPNSDLSNITSSVDAIETDIAGIKRSAESKKLLIPVLRRELGEIRGIIEALSAENSLGDSRLLRRLGNRCDTVDDYLAEAERDENVTIRVDQAEAELAAIRQEITGYRTRPTFTPAGTTEQARPRTRTLGDILAGRGQTLGSIEPAAETPARSTQPQTVAGPIRSGETEPETMTDQLKGEFNDNLVGIVALINANLSLLRPDAVSSKAREITRLREKSGLLKNEIAQYENELTIATNVESVRGKISDFRKRAERIARDTAQIFQLARADWPQLFETYRSEIASIARDSGEILNEAALTKIYPRLSELARNADAPIGSELHARLEEILIESL